MTPYRHRVNYYETDKMGVTHHANYIHWMEEARIDFLDQLGWPYDKLEELGVVSPVIGLECQYKAPTTFNDQVEVAVSVRTLVLTGASSHCFMDRAGKFLRLGRDLPAFDRALRDQLPAEENGK